MVSRFSNKRILTILLFFLFAQSCKRNDDDKSTKIYRKVNEISEKDIPNFHQVKVIIYDQDNVKIENNDPVKIEKFKASFIKCKSLLSVPDSTILVKLLISKNVKMGTIHDIKNTLKDQKISNVIIEISSKK